MDGWLLIPIFAVVAIGAGFVKALSGSASPPSPWSFCLISSTFARRI
jgi:hypothetical protein